MFHNPFHGYNNPNHHNKKAEYLKYKIFGFYLFSNLNYNTFSIGV